MNVTWSQQLNPEALRARLTAKGGGVLRDLLRRGLLVESAAKRNLSGIGGPKRIDTGRLRASITTIAIDRDQRPVVLVGTNVKYARWVHDGTGIYGPRGTRIHPRSAKVLVWPSVKYGKSKGKFRGKAVARWTRGMRPNPFLKNALIAAKG